MKEDLKNKSMRELVELLTLNDEAKFKIYDDYKRAADMDLIMLELRKEENSIRMWISSKMGN